MNGIISESRKLCFRILQSGIGSCLTYAESALSVHCGQSCQISVKFSFCSIGSTCRLLCLVKRMKLLLLIQLKRQKRQGLMVQALCWLICRRLRLSLMRCLPEKALRECMPLFIRKTVNFSVQSRAGNTSSGITRSF